MNIVEVARETLDVFFSKEENIRLKSQALFEMLKDKLEPKLEETEFKILFSKAMHDGKFPGLVLVRGKYGGIRRIDGPTPKFEKEEASDSLDESDQEENDDELALTLYITPSLRIYPTDSRNWTIQKKAGNDAWASKYYYPSLESALSGCVRMIINKELKSKIDITQLKDIRKAILDLEEKLTKQLSAVIVAVKNSTEEKSEQEQ